MKKYLENTKGHLEENKIFVYSTRFHFDKALRKKERLNVEKKLNEFWSKINKLGPHKTVQIPNNVYEENSVLSDTDVVLT